MSERPFKTTEIGADKVCLELRRRLTGAAVCGRVLAVFEHAICLATSFGLVTILAENRGLQPFSAVLAHKPELSKLGCAANQQALLMESAICFETFNVILTKAIATDLSIRNNFDECIISSNYIHYLPILLGLLNTDKRGGCLDALVLEGKGNVFSERLKPHARQLAKAVSDQDVLHAGKEAEQIAGCGIGLTPSSDDFLTGYMTMLHAMCIGYSGERSRKMTDILHTIGQRATLKTNAVSGAFLMQASCGYASEDMICLLRQLRKKDEEQAVRQAAQRVLAFGSTSGRDILTGVAFAIQYHAEEYGI